MTPQNATFHSRRTTKATLGRLSLALVTFCDFEIFRFIVCFNLANSWKISELEKMVSNMVFREYDSTCVKLKRVTTCMKVNSAKLQKYRKFVDENYREPVDGKFPDGTERILKLIGAQNAGPGEDDDDEDIEHRVFSTLNDVLTQY